AAADDAGTGTVAWSNPTNGETSNDTYAIAGLASSTSHYLKLTGFGFAVPSGATITGVTATIERNVSGTTGDIHDASVKLVKAGSVTGSDKADTLTSWTWSASSDTTATYG